MVALTLLALFAVGCAGAASAPPVPVTDVGRDAPGALPGGGEAPVEPVPGEDGEAVPPDGALIVRTGRLELEVTDIGASLGAAAQVVSGLGGYVSASQEQNDGTHRSATITYRIPADRWDEALSGLRALAGRVIGENTQAVEVTAAVVDLDARIANLTASEAALQSIMTRAGTIDDVLKVQKELSTVRGQIEQLAAERDHLQEQAALATLAVTFSVPIVAVATAHEGWNLGAEVDRAVAQLVTIGQRLASFAVWLAIVALPVLLPVVLILFLGVRLYRRYVPAVPPPSQPGASV